MIKSNGIDRIPYCLSGGTLGGRRKHSFLKWKSYDVRRNNKESYSMKLEAINIYRMTHIKNIPHILNFGITHKNSLNANPNFTTIGDVSLINTRSNKQIGVNNHTITLGDFIPFYFGVKMPMLYVIQNGGNFVPKATPPQDIVYLVCPIIKIIQSNNNIYYFSDGHATDKLTSFYDKNNISNLPSIIDEKAITASFWGGGENLDIKRKKQAEFLVQNDISTNYIKEIVCFNEIVKQELINKGATGIEIKVFPSAYY